MGNKLAKQGLPEGTTDTGTDTEKRRSFAEKIDAIAHGLILKSSFKDLMKSSSLEHCDKLITLTANALNHNLNAHEIDVLSERVTDGIKKEEENKDKELPTFVTNQLLKQNGDDNRKKYAVCINIAKYYIKIFHLFGAIVTTLNPIYKVHGRKHTLLERNDIDMSGLTPIFEGMCQMKIKALINNHDYNVDKNTNISIRPEFCNINVINGRLKNLKDEPGIPELENLYMDEYDEDTDKFSKMSDKMKKQYKKDVETLYTIFSGNSNVPKDANGISSIKRFSDIKLKDFHLSDGCNRKSDSINFQQEYIGTLKQKLFSDFVNLIKSMGETTQKNQEDLLKILDEIFTSVHKKHAYKKSIVINPELTADKLDSLIERARGLIIKLYITYEEQFIEGINIFKSIIEKLITDQTKSSIENLEKQLYDPPTEEQINKKAAEKQAAEKQAAEKQAAERRNYTNVQHVVHHHEAGHEAGHAHAPNKYSHTYYNPSLYTVDSQRGHDGN